MLTKLKHSVKKIFPHSVKHKIKKFLLFLKINSYSMVRIDATTLCQLDCSACYMRLENYGAMGKGWLKFADFKRFVDNNPSVKQIELSNSGEMFLNPDLLEIMKYAFEKHILLTADNGVNFNNASDEIIEALVKYKFYSIVFSIDGHNPESYAKYRVNGDFNTVINNIKKLQNYKKQYQSSEPAMRWQYIVMEGNDTENDIISVKKLAKELDIQLYFKPTWDTSYMPANPQFIKKETGLQYWDNEELIEGVNSYYCYQLWYHPQINYDGRLLGCCTVYKDDFGVNVFDVGLKAALKSENFLYAKKMLQGKVPAPADTKNIPCANCQFYKKMVANNKFI